MNYLVLSMSPIYSILMSVKILEQGLSTLLYLILYVYYSFPLTFSRTLPLVSDLANESRRGAIEDARFVPLLLTARPSKRTNCQTSNAGIWPKTITISFFPSPLTPSFMLVLLTRLLQKNPKFSPNIHDVLVRLLATISVTVRVRPRLVQKLGNTNGKKNPKIMLGPRACLPCLRFTVA